MSGDRVLCLLNDPRPRRDRGGGVMRYTRRVAEGLAAAWGDRFAVFSPERLVRDPSVRWVRSPLLPAARLVPIHDLRLPGIARRLRPRVVWAPYFGRFASGVPEVFTVHDLTYFAAERRGGWRGWMEELVRREMSACFRRAARLIAVSETTARELRGFFPEIPAERIVVVPHGVDRTFLDAPDPPSGESARPAFLFVGQRGGYKNFLRLVEAWRIAGLRDRATVRVVAPPGSTWTEAEARALRESGAGDSIGLVEAISDEALRTEYARAIALVYPSSREGFGMPLLEAMACRTLVICSDATCLPEVGGAVPFYHAADSAEALASRLREVLALPAADRRRRVAEGRARAETFTWERAVDRTRGVLEEVAGESTVPRT